MARVSGRSALPILGKVFLLLGLGLLLVSGIFAATRASFLSGAGRADGTVVALRHNGRSYQPVIDFTPEGGPTTRVESVVGSNPPEYRVGDHVPMRFQPNHPEEAVIDTFWHLWFFAALFGIIGSPFTITGILMSILARKGAAPKRATG